MLSHVRPFVTLWTVARQAPLSMESSRQEYWSELPFPTLSDSCAVLCLVSQSCPTLCDPMDWSPPGSSVFGIWCVAIHLLGGISNVHISQLKKKNLGSKKKKSLYLFEVTSPGKASASGVWKRKCTFWDQTHQVPASAPWLLPGCSWARHRSSLGFSVHAWERTKIIYCLVALWLKRGYL